MNSTPDWPARLAGPRRHALHVFRRYVKATFETETVRKLQVLMRMTTAAIGQVSQNVDAKMSCAVNKVTLGEKIYKA